jgi:hypothetical protein
MATPRQTIADQLTADYPGHKVYAYPYAPTEVRANVIAVWRTDLAPHPASPNKLRHSLTIAAYGKATLEERAEAELDDLLDDIMLSLQRLGVEFTSAERTVFAESFQGWTVKCAFDSENVYRQTIITERP